MYPDKNQARRGGLEKYPRSKFCDHNQYCASSPYSEKLVKKEAQILRPIITKTKQAKNLLTKEPPINKKTRKHHARYYNLGKDDVAKEMTTSNNSN